MARGETRVLSLNNYVGSVTRGETDALERYCVARFFMLSFPEISV
jgi:hypothetical protein